MVFNATFNSISVISQQWRKPEYEEKTTDLSQCKGNGKHNKLCESHKYSRLNISKHNVWTPQVFQTKYVILYIFRFWSEDVELYFQTVSTPAVFRGRQWLQDMDSRNMGRFIYCRLPVCFKFPRATSCLACEGTGLCIL